MQCPFLKETHVRFCCHSAHKMIVRDLDCTADEKCSSPRYSECAIFRKHSDATTEAAPTCPFLEESRMQYCAAASFPKYIPYNDSVLSRCSSAGYRYCESYASLASAGRAPVSERGGTAAVAGLPVPEWLYYAPNHMWMDVAEDGVCHVGVDSFFGRVVGRAECLYFISVKDIARPAVVITARGVDLHFVFPQAIRISDVNVRLFSEPVRLTADPYRLGWLIRGRVLEPAAGGSAGDGARGLMSGAGAAEWMRGEVERMMLFVGQNCLSNGQPRSASPRVLNDGGEFEGNVVRHLNHDQILRLFNAFFSPTRGD